MNTEELKNFIKNAEQNEKDSRYYKERYEELRKEVKIALNNLLSILGDKVIKEKSATKTPSKINEISETLYKEMTQEKVLEANPQLLRKRLIENDISDNEMNLFYLRTALRNKKGINYRKEGNTMIFFYVKESEDKINFIKTSFMG